MNKKLLLPLTLAFVFPGFAADDIDTFDLQRQLTQGIHRKDSPKLDSKGIVRESNSFLKEREPEMTSEEYALYEKVVTMLTTNVEFAVRMLEAMMNEKEPPSPAFEFILGNAYYGANQSEKAEKSYRSAVTRYPTFQRAWNNLGVLYYTSNRFRDAVACFSKAVVLGDRSPTTMGLLGFSLEKEGNLVSAEMAYMQALSGDPSNGDWKEGLLRIYIDGRQFGRAESLVRSLIKDQPTETRFWLTYATILISDRRKLEALALLETATGTGVAGVDELLLLGDLYAEQGLAPEAVAIYEKVLRPAQDLGEGKLLHFARVLIAADKLPQAEQALAALKGERSPAGRLALLQTKADLAIARKRWGEARKEVEALLAIAPLNGRALLTLGRTHLEEENLPRATFAFEAAYRIPETAYRASLELANIELKNRRYAKSVEYLEHALTLQKSDAVEDYLARIKTLVGTGTSSG
jgi:tetratricopeptide (TPR) repeat protein